MSAELPFIVKICGITNEEDARIAVEAGANALGFNFYPRSPRYVMPLEAQQIVESVRGRCLNVGVFVNPSENELAQVVESFEIDVIQIHGDRGAIPSNRRVWKSIDPQTKPLPDSRIEAYLLDKPSPEFGGSGRSFPWQLAANFPYRSIIAGGLDASNVASAVAIAAPWGVDACSRLESEPGKKNAKLVRDFVAAALAAFCEREARMA